MVSILLCTIVPTYLNEWRKSWETCCSDATSFASLWTSLDTSLSASTSSHIMSNLLCKLVMISPCVKRKACVTVTGKNMQQPLVIEPYCLDLLHCQPKVDPQFKCFYVTAVHHVKVIISKKIVFHVFCE